MRDEPLDLVDSWYCNVSGHTTLAAPDQDSLVAAITALVAERVGEERERYAVKCDEIKSRYESEGESGEMDAEFAGWALATADECARAIRKETTDE